jgi:hypothetical protein
MQQELEQEQIYKMRYNTNKPCRPALIYGTIGFISSTIVCLYLLLNQDKFKGILDKKTIFVLYLSLLVSVIMFTSILIMVCKYMGVKTSWSTLSVLAVIGIFVSGYRMYEMNYNYDKNI